VQQRRTIAGRRLGIDDDAERFIGDLDPLERVFGAIWVSAKTATTGSPT
jgi:hypothetical protein